MKTFAQHAELTPREMQVLYLLICGRSSRDVAEILAITQHTVRRHRRCIFEKFFVRNTAELLREAFTSGWARMPQRAVVDTRVRYVPRVVPMPASRGWSAEATL